MNKVLHTGILISVLAVLAVLFVIDPSQVHFFPACPFHQITGLDCPGCGSTRAVHALLHGQLVAALHFNAMLVVSLPLFAWLGFRFLQGQIKGKPQVVIQPIWAWCFLAAWAAFGVLRNLPVQPFPWFAP
jgi:Protein of unknown function (DUF2752)